MVNFAYQRTVEKKSGHNPTTQQKAKYTAGEGRQNFFSLKNENYTRKTAKKKKTRRKFSLFFSSFYSKVNGIRKTTRKMRENFLFSVFFFSFSKGNEGKKRH